ADDVDVASVHQEFYGIPWNEFAAGAQPPAAWVAQMDAIAKNAKDAKLDVFLSISPISSSRDRLAERTVIDGSGQVKTDNNWSPPCYDFATAPDRATAKSAYLAYVAWMIDRFAPKYLNVGIELNLFFEKCPGQRAGVIDVINAAYDAAKAKSPNIVAFPSFQ